MSTHYICQGPQGCRASWTCMLTSEACALQRRCVVPQIRRTSEAKPSLKSFWCASEASPERILLMCLADRDPIWTLITLTHFVRSRMKWCLTIVRRNFEHSNLLIHDPKYQIKVLTYFSLLNFFLSGHSRSLSIIYPHMSMQAPTPTSHITSVQLIGWLGQLRRAWARPQRRRTHNNVWSPSDLRQQPPGPLAGGL